MNFLEKDLEEIIYNADKEMLTERGLPYHPFETFKRQLKIGNYGIADLVSFKKPYYNQYLKHKFKGNITIHELKKDRISISTFLQAANYLKGIKSYLEQRDLDQNYDYTIRLIGKDLDMNSSFVYLPDIINSFSYDHSIERESCLKLELYTYKYHIDGISFKEITGYKLINEGF